MIGRRLLAQWGAGKRFGGNTHKLLSSLLPPVSNNHPSVSMERNNPFNFIIIDCFGWPLQKVKTSFFFVCVCLSVLANVKGGWVEKKKAARERLTHTDRLSCWASDNLLADWWWGHTNKRTHRGTFLTWGHMYQTRITSPENHTNVRTFFPQLTVQG